MQYDHEFMDHKNYKISEKRKKEISEFMIGNQYSVGNPGNRAPRTEAQMKAIKAPRTESQMEAVKRPKSAEAKRKMSEAKKGKPWSEARREAWWRTGR